MPQGEEWEVYSSQCQVLRNWAKMGRSNKTIDKVITSLSPPLWSR